MLAGSARINGALAWWVRRVLRLPKTTAVLVLALSAAGLYVASGRLGINTDTADMISPELPWRRDFIAYRDSFPVRDRNIVVVVEAATADTAAAFAADLAAALRREPERFGAVFAAGEGPFFERNGLLYLSTEQIRDLGDRLAAAQPLLGLLGRQFNGAGVVAVTRRAAVEAEGGAPSAELDTLHASLAATLEAAAAGERRPLAWRELLGAAAAGPARELVLVSPVLDFDAVRSAREPIERLREIAAELRGDADAAVTVRLTGTVAMEHEELESVIAGAALAGIASLVLVTIVLLWALRSLVLLAISIVTLLAGLAFTATFAALAVGHLNLLSVAFAVLYVGLGVDFILHVFLRFEELRRAGRDVDGALVETARGVGTSLFICAVTTAAAFYAFLPTAFDGVSELGLISGTGMLISLAISLTLLPALVALLPERFTAVRAARGRRAARSTAGAVTAALRHPRYVLAAAAIVGFVCIGLLPRVTFDSNPIHLRDPDSESVRTLEDLAAAGDAPVLGLVALAPDHDTAVGWARALEVLPEVSRATTVDALVPAEQAEKQLLLEDIGLVMGPGFADLDAAAYDEEALRAELRALRSVLEGATADDARRRLLAAVEAFLRSVEAGGAERLRALDEDLTATLPRELQRLEAGLHAQPFERSDLPPELLERWVNDEGEELVEIVPAENVNENEAAERFVSAVRGIVPAATGLPVVHEEASATIVRAFQLAFTYALVLVTLLLGFFLRNAVDVVLVLVPVLFAAVVSAGAAVLLGIPFNFANIITLPLLVGVGTDNGIHLVHRMRTEPPADGDPFRTSTSRAMLASGLTTIASFGNLAFSPHVGMASMGRLLTLGMLVTLASTLIVLPALLRARLRK